MLKIKEKFAIYNYFHLFLLIKSNSIKVGPDEIRRYGAQVLGIVSGVSRDGKYLMASWATKVKERWNDVEYLTCEFQYYYTCL
jgi:hypothetical protein